MRKLTLIRYIYTILFFYYFVEIFCKQKCVSNETKLVCVLICVGHAYVYFSTLRHETEEELLWTNHNLYSFMSKKYEIRIDDLILKSCEGLSSRSVACSSMYFSYLGWHLNDLFWCAPFFGYEIWVGIILLRWKLRPQLSYDQS